MKQKYFNVLQENEKQKESIKSFIQKEIDRDSSVQKMTDEK